MLSFNGLSQQVCHFLRPARGSSDLKELFRYLQKSPRFGPLLEKLFWAYQQEQITYHELEEEVCTMTGQTFSEKERGELKDYILQQLQLN